MTTAPRLDATHGARYVGGARRTTTHVVWHATAGASAESSLGWMNRPNARETGGVASYHYLIERDGTLYQHAPHHLTAYHAGVSAWPYPDGASLNARSLGIAFANRQVGPTSPLFERISDQQIATAVWLIDHLSATYPSVRDPAAHLRHRDCAPTRRNDPTPETLDFPKFVEQITARWSDADAAHDVQTAQRWTGHPAAERVIAQARTALAMVQSSAATLEALLLDLEGGD